MRLRQLSGLLLFAVVLLAQGCCCHDRWCCHRPLFWRHRSCCGGCSCCQPVTCCSSPMEHIPGPPIAVPGAPPVPMPGH
jgi:hypothetical protein